MCEIWRWWRVSRAMGLMMERDIRGGRSDRLCRGEQLGVGGAEEGGVLHLCEFLGCMEKVVLMDLFA